MVNKNYIYGLLLTSLWVLLLAYVYQTQISVFESYVGLVSREYPLSMMVAGLGIVLTPIAWLPRRLNRPSAYALWYSYVTMVLAVPLVSYMLETSYRTSWIVPSLIAVLANGVMALAAHTRIALPRYIIDRRVVNMGVNVIFIVTIIVAIYTLSRFGGSLVTNLLDSVSVYDRRLWAREVVESERWLGYVMAISSGTMIPFSVGYAFNRRKYIYIIVALISALSVYSLDATKSTIMGLVLLIVVAVVEYARRGKRFYAGYNFVLVSGCIIVASILIYELLGNYNITALTTRRIFVVPAQAGYLHYTFFSSNSFVFLTDSIFGLLFSPVYDLPVPTLLGREYFGNSEMALNVGIMPSGYAHAGIFGVMLSAIVAGLILSGVDKVYLWSGNRVMAVVVSVHLAQVWSEQAIHTSMMSSGVAPLLVIYYLFSSYKTRGDRPSRRYHAAESMHTAI